MERMINDCILACETCVCDCLCSGKAGMSDCVRLCLMCERVCKALKVSMKCGGNKEVLNCLKVACKKSCMACVAECKKHNMACCKKCVTSCSKMAHCCDTKKSSKKSSKKTKKMKGGYGCGKNHKQGGGHSKHKGGSSCNKHKGGGSHGKHKGGGGGGYRKY